MTGQEIEVSSEWILNNIEMNKTLLKEFLRAGYIGP